MSDWVMLKNGLGLTLRLVDVWPDKMTPPWAREAGPFSAALKDTLGVLRRELNALQGKNIVLQIAFREKDLRLDGLPRAGAIAEHPGVILLLDSRHGPLRLWFDKFTKWQNNLRALAMHLEHLRLASLYGVGQDGQQYRGWQALPAPEPKGARRDVAETIAKWAGEAAGLRINEIMTSSETLIYYYRLAVKKAHPDQGGTAEAFRAVQSARETLLKK